mmetsp:Transcript_6361/g.14361  ORF Transcript_6361/g.14361 Transcript_6361/m.14361 type:complete len:143 (-) Transcript_6361:118-546(-)
MEVTHDAEVIDKELARMANNNTLTQYLYGLTSDIWENASGYLIVSLRLLIVSWRLLIVSWRLLIRRPDWSLTPRLNAPNWPRIPRRWTANLCISSPPTENWTPNWQNTPHYHVSRLMQVQVQEDKLTASIASRAETAQLTKV